MLWYVMHFTRFKTYALRELRDLGGPFMPGVFLGQFLLHRLLVR